MFRILQLVCIASIWIFLSTLLGPPEFSYLNSFFQSCFMLFWSYAGHIFAHKASQMYPLNIVNTHISFHHDGDLKSKYSKFVDLFLESLNNFIGFFVLYIFQIIFGLHIFSLRIILFAAFLYIGIHIFYYTLTQNGYHVEHHLNESCNYSPEIFDILFQTKKPGEYEDVSFVGELLPAVVALGLASLF